MVAGRGSPNVNSQADALAFFQANTPFASVKSTTLKIIASRCRRTSRQPGEHIFVEGDPCRDLYVLVTGRVKCYRATPEGREQVLKVFERPGEMFCTTSAFSTGAHIVTAEAMNEVALYVIDADTIKRVSLEEPALALALVTAAGEQMRSLVVLVDDLALKTATTRVAKLLLERGQKEGRREGKRVRLSRAHLREEDIAAMVGAVRVHVSRSLKALAMMGVVTLERETISIPDLSVLDGFLRAAEPERSTLGPSRPARGAGRG